MCSLDVAAELDIFRGFEDDGDAAEDELLAASPGCASPASTCSSSSTPPEFDDAELASLCLPPLCFSGVLSDSWTTDQDEFMGGGSLSTSVDTMPPPPKGLDESFSKSLSFDIKQPSGTPNPVSMEPPQLVSVDGYFVDFLGYDYSPECVISDMGNMDDLPPLSSSQHTTNYCFDIHGSNGYMVDNTITTLHGNHYTPLTVIPTPFLNNTHIFSQKAHQLSESDAAMLAAVGNDNNGNNDGGGLGSSPDNSSGEGEEDYYEDEEFEGIEGNLRASGHHIINHFPTPLTRRDQRVKVKPNKQMKSIKTEPEEKKRMTKKMRLAALEALMSPEEKEARKRKSSADNSDSESYILPSSKKSKNKPYRPPKSRKLFWTEKARKDLQQQKALVQKQQQAQLQLQLQLQQQLQQIQFLQTYCTPSAQQQHVHQQQQQLSHTHSYLSPNL